MMQIFVRKTQGNTITLNVESYETICSVMSKFKEKEGIPSDLHLKFIYAGKLLDDWRNPAHYNIVKESTLHVYLSLHSCVKSWQIYIKTWSDKIFALEVNSLDTINSVKARIQEVVGIPPHLQSLSFLGTRLEDRHATLSDYNIPRGYTLHLQKARGAIHDLLILPYITSQVNPLPPAKTSEQQTKTAGAATQITPSTKQSAPGKLTQLNVTSQVNSLPLTTPHAPQQAKTTLAATQTTPGKATPNNHSIFGTSDGEVCAEYIQGLASSADRHALSHNNYDAKLKLFALHQAKATAALSDLMPEIRAGSPPSVLTGLEDVKRELATARSKEKELEATISKLIHKNKVFSAQCATYESQVIALEVENKTTKEELMNADKKYHARARAAGYAEGLKEGKAKRLKSVEFLHHLADASMQYLEYGFDSCQKQAEQQGFVGKLNKDSALKEAPELKGWDSSALSE